ncbi:MAG TPA: zinc metalloprotease [Micromonosporaceae bacterium]|nr:zinc metalloprotease [Micromonosporaceae bacterium]
MRVAKSLSVLAVSGLTYAAVGMIPAAGAAGPAAAAQAAFCSASDLASASPTAVISGRGGDNREPDLGEVHEDLPAAAKGKSGRNFRATVPVYFHVVTDGAVGAVTDEQIATQISVLNNTYAGGEGGATSGFSFVLAGVTRTDNADWFYANPGGTNEHTMKRTLRQGGPGTLNYYSTTAGAYLGWAYLPSIVTKPGQAYLDGVVVDWESMVGTSTRYADQYDQGETGTHEVGHWLNLEHTFFGGCNAKGDFVDDTPAQKTATRGCPEGKDTCKEPGLDPIHNYMDYSYDSCYTEFTAGQVQRMRDAWLFYRAAA